MKGVHMTETKKRGPNAHTKDQKAKAAGVPIDQIREIFEYWKTACKKQHPVLDENRKRRIGWAIATYGMENCRKAIDGCAGSDWHMGENAMGKSYNDITLIFRNAEKVESFLERAEKKTSKNAKEEWINSSEPF